MAEIKVDMSKSQSAHSIGNRMARVLWGIVWLLLFRISPKVLYGWRRSLLRLFGARIGRNAWIHPSVRIWAPWNLEMGDYSTIGPYVDCYCVGRVIIGSHAIISQYSYICTVTHDYRTRNMQLIVGPIMIGSQAWVCAGAFVGPSTVVGEGAVIGARSCVVKDVAPWTVVAGNPARQIRERVIIDGDKNGIR